jgi:hypothetical protein
MHTQPSGALELVAWASLGLAAISASIIVVDIARDHRQKMAVMNIVYPVSALYWGPVGLWFYWRHGRRRATSTIEREGEVDVETLPRWTVLANAVSHCGAGCTIGDIGGEWLVFAFSLMIAGESLYADFAFDFAFAWVLGVAFQYFTIVPMRQMRRWQGLWTAIKADTLSIVAFQVGLFAGMATYQKLLFDPGLAKTTSSYWMMMQVSMVIGFFTAWPMNAWLIRRSIKEAM